MIVRRRFRRIRFSLVHQDTEDTATGWNEDSLRRGRNRGKCTRETNRVSMARAQAFENFSTCAEGFRNRRDCPNREAFRPISISRPQCLGFRKERSPHFPCARRPNCRNHFRFSGHTLSNVAYHEVPGAANDSEVRSLPGAPCGIPNIRKGIRWRPSIVSKSFFCLASLAVKGKSYCFLQSHSQRSMNPYSFVRNTLAMGR